MRKKYEEGASEAQQNERVINSMGEFLAHDIGYQLYCEELEAMYKKENGNF